MVCQEGGNVCAHFTVMEDLHQQIAALGSDITDHDFACILKNALPSSYHHILGNIAAVSTSSKEAPTTDTVLQFAFAKYDCHVIKSNSIEADALAIEAQGQLSWYTGACGTWRGARGAGVGVCAGVHAGVCGWGMHGAMMGCGHAMMPYMNVGGRTRWGRGSGVNQNQNVWVRRLGQGAWVNLNVGRGWVAGQGHGAFGGGYGSGTVSGGGTVG